MNALLDAHAHVLDEIGLRHVVLERYGSGGRMVKPVMKSTLSLTLGPLRSDATALPLSAGSALGSYAPQRYLGTLLRMALTSQQLSRRPSSEFSGGALPVLFFCVTVMITVDVRYSANRIGGAKTLVLWLGAKFTGISSGIRADFLRSLMAKLAALAAKAHITVHWSSPTSTARVSVETSLPSL
ncbi:hypothetical protein S7711_11108 [Stachybotrys chartarum IBT 7711]|uniref:Uncharacterized protein n=1 Tax=Stachybotrys chartarum (strain CBS 109288 / IBT 7711) TaxID=1280523 RepID=A0A084ASL2_STACB|nr:hypothetical protein S7711_11108 [Stachybotrys chartarum IBT 7711]